MAVRDEADQYTVVNCQNEYAVTSATTICTKETVQRASFVGYQ